jgi:hypothetical protein
LIEKAEIFGSDELLLLSGHLSRRKLIVKPAEKAGFVDKRRETDGCPGAGGLI